MLFTLYGDENKPVILLMHGMFQDWHSMYEKMKYLENDYRLIVPSMDGMYDGAPVFESLEKECEQIEEYLNKNFGGHIPAAYGASQGATLLLELLARNKVKTDYVFLDGLYCAHQGNLSAFAMEKLIWSATKNNGKFPKFMDYAMKKMGLDTENDYSLLTCMYFNSDRQSIHNNMYSQYNYRAKESLANSEAKVYLWCGSEEPYALKSNKIAKKYLRNYEEEIWQGLGHGIMFYTQSEKLCENIKEKLRENGV